MFKSINEIPPAPPGAVRSIGLLVVDPRVRGRLQAQLSALPGWRVAFACAGTDEAMRCLAGAAPSLLLVDLALPQGGALELLRQVGRWWPGCVAVAMCAEALSPDSRDPYALLRGLNVLAGAPAVPPARPGASPRSAAPSPAPEALTEREAQVLWHVAHGARYEEMAHALGVTVNTVRHHIRAIYGKLGVNSRGRAAVEAQRRGLLPPMPMAA